MKAKEILKAILPLPGVLWGIDVFNGKTLFDYSIDTQAEFIDVTHRFDSDKDYFVVWARSCVNNLIEQLPHYDIIISKGELKKYGWEIEE